MTGSVTAWNFQLNLNANVDGTLAINLNQAAAILLQIARQPSVDAEEIMQKLGEVEELVNKLYP
jgi:hypothetical protein